MQVFSPEQCAVAIDLMKNGGVIVYPTETSYGIGCDATNVEAVAKVFAIKGRPEGKGVTVLLPAADPFGEKDVEWDPRLRELAMRHWPGPLNIVLTVKPTSTISPQCYTGTTLAVRRSSHPIAALLVDGLGVPLVSTSANVSGEPELYDAQAIYQRFLLQKQTPDAILDAGVLLQNPPSTVVGIVEGEMTVLRQGAIILF